MTEPEPLIFPVGHYLGAVHGAPVTYHRIRVGERSVRLDTTDQVTIWALSHGVPELAGDGPWTRARVERLARDGGIVNPAGVIDRLLADGLLAEVTLGTPAAAEFARRHRLRPLMIGMGNTAEDPQRFRIGYADQPAIEVSRTLYELWQWGHLFDLWQTCKLFAEVDRDTATPGGPAATAGQLLTGFLPELHLLLSHTAAYLDEADTGG